jgi:coenzyme F420-0:L-glutamate ligase / coenzyme F420-1:gamma-L-glutamate ligase
MTTRELTLTAIPGLPDVQPGADLAALILEGLERINKRLESGDVIVVAQKIVSKAEGRMVRLDDVVPSEEAVKLARETHKDPRHVEVVLRETREVVRAKPGVIVVEDRRGLVLANAGVDASNVSASGDSVLMLPVDPDASAKRLRQSLLKATGVAPAVLIIDSLGRAWRLGTIGVAIGVAGMQALADLRGRPDMHGRRLETSELAQADELAAGASLVMGQADERCPVVLARGLRFVGDGKATDLQRSRSMEMFR